MGEPVISIGRRALAVVGLAALSIAAASAAAAVGPASGAEAGPSLTTGGLPLDGATTGTSFTVRADGPALRKVTFVLDGKYLGADRTRPFTWKVRAAAGAHLLKARAVDSARTTARLEADFTADGDQTVTPATPTPSTSPAAAASNTSRHPSGPVWRVGSSASIRSALAEAKPGDVIEVAPGEYTFKPRLVASANGTAAAPITLRGPRTAVLRTKNASGDYGLHLTGDHWRVEGITVAHASKGIVLDGSVGTVLDGVQVHDIGAEAVHFRTCSTDGVLRNSFIHDTGRTSAQYGEGVYVGSANSNWDTYECTDATSGQDLGDNSEQVLVEGNLFRNITAEGADLKEGTDSGVLRNNRFEAAGVSGRNSADSAVDAKGNNWVIAGNTVADTEATWDDDGVVRPSEFLDGFQAHSVYPGYGVGNLFARNTVEGSIEGFGFGLYPLVGNTVRCDNVAGGAALGVVGDRSKPATCSR